MAMIPTELAFLEFIFADNVELEETMLSKAPKGFDAVDVVLATGELVLVVVDAMMAKPLVTRPS